MWGGSTRVDYVYTIPEVVRKYVRNNQNNRFFVEVPGNVTDVPKEILAIPFVGTMLTVAMLLKVGISVPRLDTTYLKSVQEMGDVFHKMYPNADLLFSVKADSVSSCEYDPKSGSCSLFFTGGVDATSALVELLENNETPLLVNVWGGDLRLTDDDSHHELERYLERLTTHLGLDYCFVKSNAREMFDEDGLGEVCENVLGHHFNHGWWSSIAHVIVMSGVIAPEIWQRKVGVHYIGSSYDATNKYFDSNNAQAVEAVKYASCRFTIVDDKIDRVTKVNKVIRYREKNSVSLQLKVCWKRIAGKNCCACEKCYRTIMNIIACHGDPNDFGFQVDQNVMKSIRNFLKQNVVSLAYWEPIQRRFCEDQIFWQSNNDVNWILNTKINSFTVYIRRLKNKIIRK